jgi:hypothetical protein
LKEKKKIFNRLLLLAWLALVVSGFELYSLGSWGTKQVDGIFKNKGDEYVRKISRSLSIENSLAGKPAYLSSYILEKPRNDHRHSPTAAEVPEPQTGLAELSVDLSRTDIASPARRPLRWSTSCTDSNRIFSRPKGLIESWLFRAMTPTAATGLEDQLRAAWINTPEKNTGPSGYRN